MNKILIVDDDSSLLEILRLRFQSAGFSPCTADSIKKASELIMTDIFDAAVFDMRLEKGTGIDLLREIKKIDAELPVIFLTAYGTIENAVEAMREGAFSYLTKPFDYKELISKTESAAKQCAFSRQLLRMKNSESDSPIAGTIIGKSEKAAMIRRKIAVAARSDASVFIRGESGTGKELVAKMLHASGSRNKMPFVAVNSSAIPETLMESELFGHEKGAFTGADKKKKGFFEQAQGGTIFLDEISEMPAAMQTKLLRVLENREVSPLGSERTVRLDIRLVSASNRDLLKMIETGDFRQDLFYRIHVIQIDIPPLRERKEDIPLLCAHFMKKYADRYEQPAANISGSAVEKLMEYDWPGNIRELENVIECAVVLTPADTIQSDSIELPGTRNHRTNIYREAKKEFEEVFLKQLMEKTSGNISKASRISDIYRADLYDLLKKHSIDPSDFR